MKKKEPQNKIATIITIILIIILIIVIIIFVKRLIDYYGTQEKEVIDTIPFYTSYDIENVYDNFEDKILNTYQEYKDEMSKLNLDINLEENDFVNNSYYIHLENGESCDDLDFTIRDVNGCTNKNVVTLYKYPSCSSSCNSKQKIYLFTFTKDAVSDNKINIEYEDLYRYCK